MKVGAAVGHFCAWEAAPFPVKFHTFLSGSSLFSLWIFPADSIVKDGISPSLHPLKTTYLPASNRWIHFL
jgi:hypothetical protein